jgi:putative PEP-CTERM system histidine kinase
MSFAVLSYAAAGLAYGILGLLLGLSRQGTAEGRWFLLVVGGMSIWGWLMAALALFATSELPATSYLTDTARGLLWTLSLLSMLPGGAWQGASRVPSAGAAVLVVLAAILVFAAGAGRYGPLVVLGSSVLVCLAIEQIFRNSVRSQKRALVPLVAGVGGVFAYDLFVFADAVLLGSVEPRLWITRGAVAVAAVPFLLVFAKRHPDWTKTLFVSRHVVFYSATMTGIGLYLVSMALVGLLIRRAGGEWGSVLHLAFSVAALGVLTLVLSSSRLRAAARVFITKHFYRNQYEYREEWLRLIRTLSTSSSEMPLDQRAIKALADIVASPGGQLWLRKETAASFEPFAAWNADFPEQEYARDAAIIAFLIEQRWIIDSAEYERDPDLYNHAFAGLDALPAHSIIVPLFHRDELLGFARLVRPAEFRALNYEDHDLLKTAGRQVAAFLAHDLATERLAEASQFQAYSKLSAFVIHDLKNLLAQQAMLVENARKFQDRPEFVVDVVKTVDNGVQRMRRLLRQLEQDSATREHTIELNHMVREVVQACSKGRGVKPSFTSHAQVWVHGQQDKLASVVSHLITNAQDATSPPGTIAVEVGELDGRALVEVRDTGVGMSEEFIRKRLFKPFDTTKGYAGMGIGVYQAREVIRALGGEMRVKSSLGVGTTVSILLPLSRSPQVAAEGAARAT